MKEKITGKKIAEMAGVSPSAVSLVKKGKGGVSEETRTNILQIMRKTGYYKKVDELAVTRNIVILFRDNINAVKQYFYNELNSIVVSMCRNLNYNLLLASIDYSDEKAQLPSVLQSENIDAVLIYGDPNSMLLSRLSQMGIAFVVLDSSREKDNQFSVKVCYEMAAYKSVSYLIELGHKDIAYIGNNSNTIYDFNLLTFAGFQRAMSEHNFTIDINRIQFDARDEESLISCIDNALSGPRMPTALFCTADHNAILALRHLHRRGIRVPEDISVIGIDDLAISQHTIPSLTTMKIDREQMGLSGVELLGKMLKGEKCQSIRIDNFELVVRESTGPCRA